MNQIRECAARDLGDFRGNSYSVLVWNQNWNSLDERQKSIKAMEISGNFDRHFDKKKNKKKNTISHLLSP